jgi:hypothetical protein
LSCMAWACFIRPAIWFFIMVVSSFEFSEV